MQHLNLDSLDTFAQQLSETIALPAFFEAVACYARGRVNGGIDMWMWAETPDGQPYMGGYTVPPGSDDLTLEVWAKNLLRHYEQAVKVTLWQQNIEASTSHERCNYACGEWIKE